MTLRGLLETGLVLIFGGGCCYAFYVLFRSGGWGEEKRILRAFSGILLALILGGICCLFFLSFFGVVSAFDIDHKYYQWPKLLPRHYRSTGFRVHFWLTEFVCAIPVTLITGVALGVLIRKRPQFYGFIAVIGVFVFSVIFNKMLMIEPLSLSWSDSINLSIAEWCYPIWLGILKIGSWIGLFLLTTSLGHHIKNPRDKKEFLSS